MICTVAQYRLFVVAIVNFILWSEKSTVKIHVHHVQIHEFVTTEALNRNVEGGEEKIRLYSLL